MDNFSKFKQRALTNAEMKFLKGGDVTCPEITAAVIVAHHDRCWAGGQAGYEICMMCGLAGVCGFQCA